MRKLQLLREDKPILLDRNYLMLGIGPCCF
nr:MAG TPA: hypothetical protein [Bacteriophage sp.]